ncbi:MAG: lipoyl(octanoyl) transferase LipB [Rhodospirillales bacterium]|nr:lipoyl(octanoyl) transferase LipB [Rhodospirillales bacterium]
MSMPPSVEWRVSDIPVPYPEALAFMEARVADIGQGRAPECVWLLEHPPLYTAGTSADPAELLQPDRFPVFRAGRGGRYTYHGPGQRIAYLMLDLNRRGRDVRAYVCRIEDWVIAALARFGVRGFRRPGYIGIWVDLAAHGGRPGDEAKIAAVGVRVRRWISYHGVSINVDPDLGHFAGIVPCGIAGGRVTSLLDLGITASAADMDTALMATFADVFGESTQLPELQK